MKKAPLLLISMLLLGAGIAQTPFFPAQYVNPFIGTGGHGHTYPGPCAPFGMVQLSPDTRLDGWDGCSGYHVSDTVIYGFSHTHLSGTGCLDYGDILFMPVTGEVKWSNKEYSSSFQHEKEKAEAGFYEVFLDKYGINAELTVTPRAGMHRYTFPASGEAGILLDLVHRDKVLESSLKIISDTEIEGMRISKEWADRQIVYFVARFSKPFDSFILSDGSSAKEISGNAIRARFNFTTLKNSKIIVKVGISAVSAEGARKNLDAEMPGWDFDILRDQARKEWNKALGTIEVKGGTDAQKIIFYTALYHTMIVPNLYMDADGRYRGRDLQIHEAKGFDNYTVFSLWDTYRAAHPLYTILDQKRTNDFINTFLVQYDQGGLLPVWELSANETYCMIGYHSIPVIADAWMKGIRGYDGEKALKAMKTSAEKDHFGLKYYKAEGFIPAEKEAESVSKTLEYAYDDWCIAQMAKDLGKEEDHVTYIRRAQQYKNLLDPETGFMRGRMNNRWFTPFDPAEVNFNYTEANSWQYSFYVPQDVSGMMQYAGGNEPFAKKLDALFTADTRTTGRQQSDITGLIGQYAHGNEPSHHMAYLYNYAGMPWKTQEVVHKICNELYTPYSDGLCGNEDCGQMSAWYIFSALGFYPVTPCSGIYAIGTPVFPEATIHLENGKTFTIRANGVSEKNFYISSASFNGSGYTKSYLSHETIMNGGEIVFEMTDQPQTNWGTGEKNVPVAEISTELITPAPAFRRGDKTFINTTLVELENLLPDAEIRYTSDGSLPDMKSEIYTKPFTLSQTATIRAFAVKKGLRPSAVISGDFLKLPRNMKITHSTAWAPQYSAGGENALADFIRGTENFRTGTWQGFEGVNLDAVLDLGEEKEVKSVAIGFLQDQGAWIFLPQRVEFYVSTDGKNFSKAGVVENDVPASQSGPVLKDFRQTLDKSGIRYIRIVAVNMGTCPEWHPGAGSKAWIFADEIVIE